MKRVLGPGARCGCDDGNCELCCPVPAPLKGKAANTTAAVSVDEKEGDDA